MIENSIDAPYVRLVNYGKRERFYASMLMQMDIAIDLVIAQKEHQGWALFRDAAEHLEPIWRREEKTTPEVFEIMTQSASFLTERSIDRINRTYNFWTPIFLQTLDLIPATPEGRASFNRFVRGY